jgi:hypothetical protein
MAYDGGSLLLSLSKDRGDLQIIGKAMSKCDLRDIDPSEFLRRVNGLANDSIDVRAAAFKILDDPGFSVYVPEHALTLTQPYAFVCAMFPVADSLFLDSCLTKLAACTNDSTTMTLLMALWYTTTQKGFDAIVATAADTTRSVQVREAAKQMSEQLDSLKTMYRGKSGGGNYEDLKEQRRKSLRGLSDERLYEFDALTEKIQAAFFSR